MFKTSTQPVVAFTRGGSSSSRSLLALTFTVAAIAMFLTLFASGAAASTSQATDIDPSATNPATPDTQPTPPDIQGETSAVPRRSVRLISHTRRARFGAKVRVRGDRGVKAHGWVKVQFRAFGSRHWGKRAKLRTNSKGLFRTTFRAARSGMIRVVDGSGRASKPGRLIVRSRIKLDCPARAVKVGQSLRLSGSIRPRGVRRVRIVIAGAGGSKVIRSNRSGHFSYRWKPRSAGDVRIRAIASGNRRALHSRSSSRRSSALRPGGASYYGPGLYGNGVACGGTLSPGTVGVAHKTLPCGTKVKFMYNGRVASARVIDRGPYIAGRDWDLTEALRNKLSFGGVGTVWTNR